MKSTLDYALDYIARGWSVIPLRPRSKEPALAIREFLSGEQKFIPEHADSWWGPGAGPEYGIGIITGLPSGIVVVDIDPRNGGDVVETTKRCPTDLAQGTGGGGVHLVCEYPFALDRVPCGKTIYPGVDRKGDGGYIVAAPSIHPSGGVYSWIVSGKPGVLPGWVLEAPASTGPEGTNEPWVSDVLAYRKGCGAGEQEGSLARLAWYFSKRLPEDVAVGLLLGWAQGLHLYNPSDPWTIEHVKQKLDGAYAKRAKEGPVTEVTIEGEASLGRGTVAPTQAEQVDDLAKARELATKARSAAAFAVERKDAHDWIIEPIIAAGCFHEILGIMKAGKSTLVNQMMRCMVNGEPFLGKRTKQCGVVYLTEQAGLSLQATLERGKLLGNDRLQLLTVADMHGFTWRQRVLAAILVAEAIGAAVVVVDTLSKLASMSADDENSAGHAMLALDPWTEAKARGIAVCFVRHSRKEGGDVGTAGRGSGAFTGDMDQVLYLQRVPGQGDYRTLTVSGRLTEEQEINLKYNAGDYEEVAETPKQAQKTNRTAERLALIPYEGEGVTVADLAAWTERHKATVKGWLDPLVEEGVVLVVPGSSPARYLRPTTLDVEVDIA